MPSSYYFARLPGDRRVRVYMSQYGWMAYVDGRSPAWVKAHVGGLGTAVYTFTFEDIQVDVTENAFGQGKHFVRAYYQGEVYRLKRVRIRRLER